MCQAERNCDRFISMRAFGGGLGVFGEAVNVFFFGRVGVGGLLSTTRTGTYHHYPGTLYLVQEVPVSGTQQNLTKSVSGFGPNKQTVVVAEQKAAAAKQEVAPSQQDYIAIPNLYHRACGNQLKQSWNHRIIV